MARFTGENICGAKFVYRRINDSYITLKTPKQLPFIEMNQVTSILSRTTDSSENPNSECADYCSLFSKREQAIQLINQFNHLVKDVQRHRGFSMGLLAGNRAFERDFESLQSHIERRLAVIEVFSEQSHSILSVQYKNDLRLSWDTIRQDWENDKLSDNFELHSHFIEQLLALVLEVSKFLESSPEFLDHQGGKGDCPRPIKQIELLNFSCSLLPSLIEYLAKIRGLSTFSAAIGSAEYQHDRKLRYLLQCAREQNDRLRHCSYRLHDILDGELKAKYVIGEIETKFVRLLELVTHDVLSGKAIHSSSSYLFDLASEIIDKYWGIVDESLDLVRSWNCGDLESWINQPNS